jgi:hypothetical protein
LCGSTCVDLADNPNDCGTCSKACGLLTILGLSNSSCQSGGCVTKCSGNLTKCSVGLNLGACADTTTDPANCGACGTVCAPGQGCLSGKCTSFLYASACWECGDGNAFPTCCQSGGSIVCLPAGAACP